MGQDFRKPSPSDWMEDTNLILRARKLARSGATIEEIHSSIGWECTPATTRERLKRVGVRVEG